MAEDTWWDQAQREPFLAEAVHHLSGPGEPPVEQVRAMVKDYYSWAGPEESRGVGGSLHIVLDDGNTEDDNVSYCVARARELGDVMGEALGLVLLRMRAEAREQVCPGSDWSHEHGKSWLHRRD